MRSETASIRALTFTSDHLTIEMEVNEDSLLCQLVPTGEGTIEVQTRAGVVATIVVDEIGCFPDQPHSGHAFPAALPHGCGRKRCHRLDSSLRHPGKAGAHSGRYFPENGRIEVSQRAVLLYQSEHRPAVTAWPDRGCPEPSA